MTRIEIDAGYDNPPTYRHPAYIWKNTSGGWSAASSSGTPMSLSNYAPNGMALQFALQDATTAEEALTAVRALCYDRFAKSARIISNGRRAIYIVDRRGYDVPDLIGPFTSHDEAEAYADENHPDNENGSVWILDAIEPHRA